MPLSAEIVSSQPWELVLGSKSEAGLCILSTIRFCIGQVKSAPGGTRSLTTIEPTDYLRPSFNSGNKSSNSPVDASATSGVFVEILPRSESHTVRASRPVVVSDGSAGHTAVRTNIAGCFPVALVVYPDFCHVTIHPLSDCSGTRSLRIAGRPPPASWLHALDSLLLAASTHLELPDDTASFLYSHPRKLLCFLQTGCRNPTALSYNNGRSCAGAN
jgi:hypothetical protein